MTELEDRIRTLTSASRSRPLPLHEHNDSAGLTGVTRPGLSYDRAVSTPVHQNILSPFEVLPAEAGRFEWREGSVHVEGNMDGMVVSSMQPEGTGYFGAYS